MLTMQFKTRANDISAILSAGRSVIADLAGAKQRFVSRTIRNYASIDNSLRGGLWPNSHPLRLQRSNGGVSQFWGMGGGAIL
jgi:hypothetical protein